MDKLYQFLQTLNSKSCDRNYNEMSIESALEDYYMYSNKLFAYV